MGESGLILLVEDEPRARSIYRHILEDEGFTVAEAKDGDEALTWLRAGNRPTLILLDLMMPDSNGWQFRRQQLADPKLAQFPVVVISAMHDPPGLLGTAALLIKPIEAHVLIAAVKRHSRGVASSPPHA